METDFESKPLERQLFTWKSWNGDSDLMTFYDCRVVKDFDIFSVGDEIKLIQMDYEHSIMQIFIDAGKVSRGECLEYEMHLTLKKTFAAKELEEEE